MSTVTHLKTSLILSSSTINTKLFKAFLSSLQFNVTTLADVEEALAHCLISMPNVILIDIMMSHAVITDFLERIRTLENGSKPYIIVCTTNDIIHQKEEMLASGADAYFVEPVLYNELYDILKEKELA